MSHVPIPNPKKEGAGKMIDMELDGTIDATICF